MADRRGRPVGGALTQGSIVSPVLANIYLHYTLDLWFDREAKRNLTGKAIMVRYADDFVVGFRYHAGAARFYRLLPIRLKKFNLTPAKEKTRKIMFNKFRKEDSEPFDFLGFEFRWVTSRRGKDIIRLWTSPKRQRRIIQDLKAWVDKLAAKSISWSGGDAYAAQVVYRDGKFFYYTSTNGTSIGVAVATSPTGPFTDIGKPLIPGTAMTGCNATHSWRGIDPTAYVDDDGQAYLYWGNNVLYWVKIGSDMISYIGSITCIAQNDPAFGPDYEEGPWFYKRGSLYYLLYPSKIPESIHYSTSSGPTGPWKYGGEIMAVQQGAGSSSTIHPGVCDFGGSSYFFYHNGALPGGGSYKHSVCIEKFAYNADGTIPKINATTGGVVTGICKLNPYDTIQAETICWESGVKTEVCSEGGIDVYSIHNGDYLKVEGVDLGSGAKSFDARVASENGSGNIELHLDQPGGETLGISTVGKTGGKQLLNKKLLFE